jgi:DNA mismatch repair protein MutS2
MDARTLRVLEYPKILEMLAACAVCSLGKDRARRLEPQTDLREIQERQAETSEACHLLDSGSAPPFGGLTDVTPLVRQARAVNHLLPEELLHIADACYATARMQDYLTHGASETPRLTELAERLGPQQELETAIRRCISEDAEVRPDASSELSRLNARATTLQGRLRDRMDSILGREAGRGILQEPLIVLRAGRYCLPVQSSHQGKFQGVMHDRSDSGMTVFMEPLEIVPLGNELRETELAIDEEITRILADLTRQVSAAGSTIESNLRVLGVLDFIFAKARLSARMQATLPIATPEPIVELRGARHPLISGKVVPTDVWLGREFSTLIITGPNTGGKTVTLKTVGLLTLMAMSGLHVPAEVGSEIGVFANVYADIGDEQSIEQSLSTFSSHMSQIVKIVNRVRAGTLPGRKPRGEATLVLLDEVGAGTDPSEGSALAKAVLTELHAAGCRTIATTHYNELKIFAYATPGTENASVEFDIKTLQPTYHLRIGQSGSSNAFDIAQRIGLPKRIVAAAREMRGEQQQEIEAFWKQMEQKRRALSDSHADARRAREEVEKLKRQYSDDLQRVRDLREKLLESGYDEAAKVVRDAEAEAQRIIADLQRQPRQSVVTEQRRREIAELKRKVEKEREEASSPPGPLSLASPAEPALERGSTAPVAAPPKQLAVFVGDSVHVPQFGKDGTVLEIIGERVAVQVGKLRVEVPLADLEPAHDQPSEEAKALAERMHTRKAFEVPTEIDLRGMMVDEAILILEKYIDDAFLAKLPKVRLIHGKGTGALREGITRYLRGNKRVKSFALAPFSEGGAGATEVTL